MEKEKLFYDLHQTIKTVGMTGDGFDHTSRNEWIKDLAGKISQMNDKTLDIVFDIYQRLNPYTKDNLEFIISHTDLLKIIFLKMEI